MANMKTLIEKYKEAFEKNEDENGKKEEVVNCMLKNELLEFAEECGVEVESRWTKDEIAEKLISPEIYDRLIKSNAGDEPQKVEVKIGEKENIQPSKPFTAPREAWESLSRTMEGNLKNFTEKSVEHWDKLENEWMARADEFQKEIEKLGGQGVPTQDYKEISVLWRNFYNKMTARFFRVSRSARERRESLMSILDRYNQGAGELLEKGEFRMDTMGNLYHLWLDMTGDIRDEFENAGSDIAGDFTELSKTWEKFSVKMVNNLNELRERQGEHSDALYQSWSRIFKDVNGQIYTGIKESRSWHEDTWKMIGEQSSNLMDHMMEGFKEMESSYGKFLRNSMEFMQSSYRRSLGLDDEPRSAYEELDNIRKRIEELEKKL